MTAFGTAGATASAKDGKNVNSSKSDLTYLVAIFR